MQSLTLKVIWSGNIVGVQMKLQIKVMLPLPTFKYRFPSLFAVSVRFQKMCMWIRKPGVSSLRLINKMLGSFRIELSKAWIAKPWAGEPTEFVYVGHN